MPDQYKLWRTVSPNRLDIQAPASFWNDESNMFVFIAMGHIVDRHIKLETFSTIL